MTHSITRLISLPVGAQIGLNGDYNAPCTWGGVLSLKVSQYIEVETRMHLDTGLLALRHDVTVIQGVDRMYVGKTFLLLHRYEESAWNENDPIVHVYGLPDDFDLSLLSTYDRWREKAEWLSAAATMCVLDQDNLSEMAQFFLKRYEIV